MTKEQEVVKTLNSMISLLGLSADLSSKETERGIVVGLSSEEPGRLIGRNGQTIDALQLLTNKMLRRFESNNCPPIILDVEGYKEARRERRANNRNKASKQVTTEESTEQAPKTSKPRKPKTNTPKKEVVTTDAPKEEKVKKQAPKPAVKKEVTPKPEVVKETPKPVVAEAPKAEVIKETPKPVVAETPKAEVVKETVVSPVAPKVEAAPVEEVAVKHEMAVDDLTARENRARAKAQGGNDRKPRGERAPQKVEANREENLIQQAKDAAKEAKRWGEKVSLPPMNAAERRLVHLALEGDEGIVTESSATSVKGRKRVIIKAV